MSNQNPFFSTETLDEILLDVATLIELSPRDRLIAENRYRKLKAHLERKESQIAPYLIDGQSMIYAQGSIATSTTIINGADDDRFDVDAVVEIDVPSNWSDSQALDILERSLKGFPNARGLERCTRCVQIQFPFMHMDVTILDRRQRNPIDRAGEIFHSPDDEPAYRVPSNPWGFTKWFRSRIRPNQSIFVENISSRRETISKSRLSILDEEERILLEKAAQQDLPPVIPNAIDAQEAVALKLLKRYLNLYYENRSLKRPPSIYLSKVTGDLGYVRHGLTVQLFLLATKMADSMKSHLAGGTRPEEFNPSYPLDKINDRWPRDGKDGLTDMRIFAGSLEKLSERLEKMASASLEEISKEIDDLFGERIGSEQRRILAERYDRRDNDSVLLTASVSGEIHSPAILTKRNDICEIPQHHFHPGVLTEIREWR
jgi:hypothetical protein